MKILALDLATRTGFAFGEHDATPRFGSKRMSSAVGQIGAFVSDFDGWLNGFIDLEKPEWVTFEAPLMLGGGASNIDTTRKLMALASHVEFVCFARMIPCREANVSTVKKFWAGNGHAKKPAMVAAARSYGFDTSDHNEADALGVWAYQVHSKFADQRHRWALGQMGAAA